MSKTFEKWLHGYCGDALIPRTPAETAEMEEAYEAGQASKNPVIADLKAEVAALVKAGEYFQKVAAEQVGDGGLGLVVMSQSDFAKHSATLGKHAKGVKDA